MNDIAMIEKPLDTLLIVDYQKGFLNNNSKKIVKPLTSLVSNKQFDYVIQTMWLNSGVNNFTECLNYEECKVDGKDAGLIKMFNKAHVYPRVNQYSCMTPELKAILKYNMTVYLCGLEWDACVLATAFQLFDYGFKFKVVEDCTGTKRDTLEEAARLVMIRQFGKEIFVKSTDLYTKKKLFGII